MTVHNLKSQCLFLDAALAGGTRVVCMMEHAHYLRNVLRVPDGAGLLAFNGRDGEWHCVAQHDGRRGMVLQMGDRVRPQADGPDIDYMFAPLKRSRLDYMVQKATELGVRRLRPVITQHTIAERVNLERMRANAIEAAEQCGVLRVPDVLAPVSLERTIEDWDTDRHLIFCDEAAAGANPIDTLQGLGSAPLAVLIGPEGGFSRGEREALLARPFVTPISLGPRIMRADTAAVAALALVNATLGDWR